MSSVKYGFMKKIKQLSILLFALLPLWAWGVAEDIDIYKDTSGFVARGQITHTVFKEGVSAADAIQSSIDFLAKEGGGEVLLQRGEYVVDQPIQLKDRVTLRGKGYGTKIVVSAKNEAGVGVILQSVKGAVLSSLSVMPEQAGQGDTGVIIDDSGECKVTDVLCQGFAKFGMWIRNNTFLSDIVGCKFADNADSNLYLQDLKENGRGGSYLPNLISGCTTYGGGKGIVLNHALVVNIIGCTVMHTQGDGFSLSSHSNSVLISGCRTYQVGGDAVVVNNSHELNISSSIFCWHRGNGIVLKGTSWVTITGNNIIDTGVRDPKKRAMTGIVLKRKCRAVQVTGNNLFNWGDQPKMLRGISEDATCYSNQFVSNNINFFEKEGILSEGTDTLVENNVTNGPVAFVSDGKPPFPDFNLDRIEAFIKE